MKSWIVYYDSGSPINAKKEERKNQNTAVLKKKKKRKGPLQEEVNVLPCE